MGSRSYARNIPQDQMTLGGEFVTGLVRLPRGEYRDKTWNGIIWPFVWCEEEERWYIARRRLAEETLGISQQALQQRLANDAIVIIKDLLIITPKGWRPTACVLFDSLPYILNGIELNAPGLKPAIKPHLLSLKGLSHDTLRDVLIYGKMPEVLRDRQAAPGDVTIYDELKSMLRSFGEQFGAQLLEIQRAASEAALELEGLRIDQETTGRVVREIKSDVDIMRQGYNGILVQPSPPEVVVQERVVYLAVDGVTYCLVDPEAHDPRYPGRVCASFGEVSYTEGQDLQKALLQILKESRYNGAKHGGSWEDKGAFLCDARRQGQTNIHKLVERAGGIREKGRIDVYWVWPQTVTDFSMLPPYLEAGAIFEYAQDNGLFETPMRI